MKINLHKPLFIKTILCVMLLCSALYSFTNGGGAPAGNTAAPGDGNCTGCHSGSLITSGTNWNNMTITSNVPTSGYVAGTSYTITVSHAMTGINKWGFSAVALNVSNAQVGTISAGTGTQTSTLGGKTYVTHTSSSNSGSGSTSWDFTWTAPNPTVGNVKIYATINAADGSGGTSGDQIFAKSLTIAEFTNLPSAIINGIPSNNIVCLGDTLNLEGDGINSPTGFAWTFTGLSASSNQNPSVVFASTGLKTIRLTTSNSFGNSIQSAATVQVVAKPNATITPTGNINICGNDSVTLTANFSANFSYEWTPSTKTTSIIKTVTPGPHSVKVTNNANGCFKNSNTVNLTQRSKPVAILQVSDDSICSISAVDLTANTPFSNYTFLNGNTVLASGTQSTITQSFSAGTKSIGLVLTDSNGCKSDTVTKPLVVFEKLPAPTITCGANSTSSVSFNWDAIVGAVSYEVSLDSGQNWNPANGNLTHTLTAIAPNSTVRIDVRAVDASPCGFGATGTAVCTNKACARVPFSVSFPTNSCIDANTDSVLVTITFANIGSTSFAIQFDGKPFTSQLQFFKYVKLGFDTVSIKIIDSTNLGCPSTDTSIILNGVTPIGMQPKLSFLNKGCAQGASTARLHYQLIGAVNSLFIYKNNDAVAFDTVLVNAIDTGTILINGLAQNDKIYAKAQNDEYGCTVFSDTVLFDIIQNPKPGFTVIRNSLTLQLTDTSATITNANRSWLFGGVIPDVLNANQTITAVFPSATTVTVQLQLTDSNNCQGIATQQIQLFPVGLAEAVLTKNTWINPNPATDVLTVTVELTQQQNVQIEMTNLLGQVVLSSAIVEANGLVQKVLDVSAIPAGVYMLSILGENTNASYKVVKY